MLFRSSGKSNKLLRLSCRLPPLLALRALLFTGPAHAAALIVEGVVSPAWLERAGKREALRTGMALSDRGRVITGPRARAMLRMRESGAVKLGEKPRLPRMAYRIPRSAKRPW